MTVFADHYIDSDQQMDRKEQDINGDMCFEKPQKVVISYYLRPEIQAKEEKQGEPAGSRWRKSDSGGRWYMYIAGGIQLFLPSHCLLHHHLYGGDKFYQSQQDLQMYNVRSH